jgi:hypothetical protein
MAANDRASIKWLQAKLGEAEAANRDLAAKLAAAKAELAERDAEIGLNRTRDGVARWRGTPR